MSFFSPLLVTVTIKVLEEDIAVAEEDIDIVGVEKKEAGWADAQFKKQDLIAFLMHEAELLDKTMLAAVQKFQTPCSHPEALLSHWRGWHGWAIPESSPWRSRQLIERVLRSPGGGVSR